MPFQIEEVIPSLHGAGFVMRLFPVMNLYSSEMVKFAEDVVVLIQSVVLFLGRGVVLVIANSILIGVFSKPSALVVGLGW